jgi:hypothetical protein
MTDRDNEHSNNVESGGSLEARVSSGRITQAEADVIKLFFARRLPENWPTSNLQRRMQSSGG